MDDQNNNNNRLPRVSHSPILGSSGRHRAVDKVKEKIEMAEHLLAFLEEQWKRSVEDHRDAVDEWCLIKTEIGDKGGDYSARLGQRGQILKSMTSLLTLGEDIAELGAESKEMEDYLTLQQQIEKLDVSLLTLEEDIAELEEESNEVEKNLKASRELEKLYLSVKGNVKQQLLVLQDICEKESSLPVVRRVANNTSWETSNVSDTQLLVQERLNIDETLTVSIIQKTKAAKLFQLWREMDAGKFANNPICPPRLIQSPGELVKFKPGYLKPDGFGLWGKADLVTMIAQAAHAIASL